MIWDTAVSTSGLSRLPLTQESRVRIPDPLQKRMFSSVGSEHLSYKQRVGSSNLSTSTKKFSLKSPCNQKELQGSWGALWYGCGCPITSDMVCIAQLVRAPVCDTGSHEFETHYTPKHFYTFMNIILTGFAFTVLGSVILAVRGARWEYLFFITIIYIN